MVEVLILHVTVLLCVSMAALSSQTLPISKEDLITDLDEFVPELLRCRKLAGVNVGIIYENETLVTKAYGFSNMETKTNVTQETLFGIASLSKAFTATLLGKVLAKSQYTWDTKVRDILGDDFYFYDELRTNQATLKDLLTHRMGYPSYNNMRHQSGLDRRTLVKKIRYLKPTLPYRASYKYNNLMYGMLTLVTEVVGGDTWENLVTKHIFQPLGMTSSTFTHLLDLSNANLATSYQVDYDGSFRAISAQYHSYWGKIGGSGSVTSNVVDMAKWVKFLLNRGQSEDGASVVSNAIIRETHTAFESIPVTYQDIPYLKPAAPVSYNHFSYGLAWRIGYYRGWRTIHHTGTSMGYLAQLTLVPHLGIGVVTSLTGDDPGHTSRRHLHLRVLDLMMGEIPWLNKTTACTMTQGGRFRSQRHRIDRRALKGTDFSIYEGTFGNFAFGNVTFYVNSSTLFMAYGDFGIWEINPKQAAHSFDGIGTGHVWHWHFWDIVFSHNQESNSINQVIIYSMERSNPPVFARGLQMELATSPPYTVCDPTSGEVSTAVNMKISPWLLMFDMFFFVLIFRTYLS